MKSLSSLKLENTLQGLPGGPVASLSGHTNHLIDCHLMKVFIKVRIGKYQFEEWKKAEKFIFKPLGIERGEVSVSRVK